MFSISNIFNYNMQGYESLGNVSRSTEPSNIADWKDLYHPTDLAKARNLTPDEIETIIAQLKKLSTENITPQDRQDIANFIRAVSENKENAKIIRNAFKNTNNKVQKFWQICTQQRL